MRGKAVQLVIGFYHITDLGILVVVMESIDQLECPVGVVVCHDGDQSRFGELECHAVHFESDVVDRLQFLVLDIICHGFAS